MKKLIAILATVIVTGGLGSSAFGQDWISFSLSGKTVWDNFGGATGTTPVFAGTGGGVDIDAILLVSTTGAADQLTSVGTEFGLRGSGTALNQVATNALSVASANPQQAIASMLAGGWAIAADMASGSNAVASDSGTAAGAASYGGGTPFEVNGVALASGSSIEEIVLAYNASASSYLAASDLGWSNPFNNTVGTSAGDGFADSTQSSANQFGVASVPEPATIALAGLGGLATLMLRRRKA